MGKSEFFELTPRLFSELRRVHRERRRELALEFALLRREVVNFSFCRPKEAVRIEDLAPWVREEQQGSRAEPRKMTRKRRREVEASCRRLFAAMAAESAK